MMVELVVVDSSLQRNSPCTNMIMVTRTMVIG